MSSSPTQKAFKRLFRNRSAMLGMVIIVLAVITALLGYLVTPDQTPNANDQILQISNKEPGFTVDILKVKRNRDIPEHWFIHTMISGQENPYELVPINGYEIINDTIVVQEYAGSATSSVERAFALADVVYALSPDSAALTTTGDQVSFNTYNGQFKIASVTDLQEQAKAQIAPRTYHMGTDKFGRDMLSRLIIGVRISLAVGFIAVIISLVVGIFLGALAGYYSGKIDEAIMWLVNVVWDIPTILLVFGITLALGRAFWVVFIAIGITMWVETARIVRGQVMTIKQQQFVEASQSMGFSDLRTIFIHILPNIMGPIIVISAANFASAILIEAGLSYLGLGVDPITPTWGRMLAENYGYIISDSRSYLALTPGFAIMIMVLAFNLIGNGLRDALDIKTDLH